MVRVVAQDLPANRAGLAAGQTCHDRLHIAGYKVRLAVAGTGAAINAVCAVGLDDCDDRPLCLTVIVGEKAGNRAGHRSDTCLQEDVGRFLAVQLPQCFQRHGRVALHDPPRDVLIALPCGILHHDPAVFLCTAVGMAHGIVIIHVRDGRIGAKCLNVVQTLRRAPLWHKYHALLAEPVGSPCDTAAVVAVCCGDKGKLTQLLAYLAAGDARIRKRVNILAQTAGDIVANTVASAQHLEGVQPKAVAFIFDVNPLDAQMSGEIIQLCERRLAVFRKTAVKGQRFFCLSQTECDGRRQRVRGSTRAVYDLERFFHVKHPLCDLLEPGCSA